MDAQNRGARFVAHAPDEHDGDPHVYDDAAGTTTEALLTLGEARARADEYNRGVSVPLCYAEPLGSGRLCALPLGHDGAHYFPDR